MILNPLGTVVIPTNWSAEQALTVCNLLEDIIIAIWDNYEHTLRASGLRNDANTRTENLLQQEANDDSYPF